MRVGNFSVEGKIILVIIPFILSIIFALSLLDSHAMKRLYSSSIATYLDHLLDMYIDEYPRHLQELLEKNGLDEAESFVESYQTRALQRMEEISEGEKGKLLVYDFAHNTFLTNVEEAEYEISPEDVSSKIVGEVHFSERRKEFYMIKTFHPWSWKIIAIASGEELRVELQRLRARNIIFSIAIGIVFIILMAYAIRKLVITPLRTLEDTAKAIQTGSLIRHIEIHTKDELGVLARTIEKMSETITKQKHELKEINSSLEEKVKDQNRDLITTNEELREENNKRVHVERDLQKSLHEKENLIREIHHRVKNNLAQLYSLVDLERDEKKNSACSESYQKLQNRIDAMGLVHSQLYQAKSIHHIQTGQYLVELLSLLRRSLHTDARGIMIEEEIQDIVLHIDIIQTLGLLVTELITNAVKHAFPKEEGGTIWVVLHRGNNNELMVEVRDNGLGYSEKEHTATGDGIGEIIISAMVEQLDGRMERYTDNGTTIQIRFSEEEDL